MSERIRVTVAIDPDVLETFKTMAGASGMSVSRCLGDWLADTAEGAQFVALKMVEARKAPMNVMREMQATMVGMTDEVNSRIDKLRVDSRVARAAKQPGLPGVEAPSSNTGLKGQAGRRIVVKRSAPGKGRAT